MPANFEFPYRPPLRTTAVFALFFGAAAAMLARTALHNQAEVEVFGIITLAPPAARILFWALAAFAATLTIAAITLTPYRWKLGLKVIIHEHSIVLPRSSWRAELREVPFASITEVYEGVVSRQPYLVIFSSEGRFAVARSLLPSAAAYAAVREAISRNTGKI